MSPLTRALALSLALPIACAAGPAGPPTQAAPALPPGMSEAVFAGGCFWCMESTLEQVPGVVDVVSGYTGGSVDGVTYKQIGTGGTGHSEAVRVIYDPERVNYRSLLDHFWVNIDPLSANGQFCDRGPHYRSALYPQTDEEKKLAAASLAKMNEKFGAGMVATKIEPWATFWVAEEYHQDFYKKEPDHYYRYRKGCGRDVRLKELWGDKAPKVGRH